MTEKDGHANEREQMFAAASYLAASLAMTMINKYIVSSLRFPGMSTLLLWECAATALSLAAVFPRRFAPLDRRVLRDVPLMTAAKAGNMFFSFVAMQYTSLPVYNVLKRLNVVFSLAADYLLRGQHFSGSALAAVALISVGALITAPGDLDYDPFGYMVALPASLCNAAYLVLSRRARDRAEAEGWTLSQTDMLFYTALYNLVVFAPLCLWELPSVHEYVLRPDSDHRHLASLLAAYTVLGAALNYVTFWCTNVTSPVATGVVGNLKGLLSTVAGFAWQGAQLTPLGGFGLALNTAGGLLYCMPPLGRGISRRPKEE